VICTVADDVSTYLRQQEIAPVWCGLLLLARERIDKVDSSGVCSLNEREGYDCAPEHGFMAPTSRELGLSVVMTGQSYYQRRDC
jgi:hypothetical protein